MSVERLTSKRDWIEAGKDLSHEYGYSHIWRRLKQIEDILGDTYDLDRLQELVESDKAGRCEIHKVKDGETVYSIFAYVNGLCPKKTNGKPFKTIATYKVDDFTRNTVDREFGKTVFLNRESAEAALAKEASHE